MAPRRIFLGGVALLVANDWVFKGAGVLPTWLTGKLSDVAGLVVAPVVLAWLLVLARAPLVTARVVAVSSVGLAFSAIKLSVGAAEALDAAVNGVTRALATPLAARTVADVTDLFALPALAIAWRLARDLAADATAGRTGALVAGLLACAATSPAYARLPPHWAVADEQPGRAWGARLDAGAIIVRFGRQSDDGAFEIGIELAAREGTLALEARNVTLDVPGQRLTAEVPADEDPVTQVPAGETESLRLVFRPRANAWARGARGTLVVRLLDGARDETLRVPLSFQERIVSWHERPSLR